MDSLRHRFPLPVADSGDQGVAASIRQMSRQRSETSPAPPVNWSGVSRTGSRGRRRTRAGSSPARSSRTPPPGCGIPPCSAARDRGARAVRRSVSTLAGPDISLGSIASHLGRMAAASRLHGSGCPSGRSRHGPPARVRRSTGVLTETDRHVSASLRALAVKRDTDVIRRCMSRSCGCAPMTRQTAAHDADAGMTWTR